MIELPVNRVEPDPDQPRKEFSDEHIASLAKSIKRHGLMQPIVVRPHPTKQGWHMVVAGECRYRAHVKLNAPTIKAIVVENIGRRDTKLRQIIENVQRLDMNPMDEAKSYGDLLQDGMSPAEIAEMLGIRPDRVDRHLALLKLDEQVAKLVMTGEIQPRTASHISRLPKQEQVRIVKAIAAGKLSSNHWDVRRAVEKAEQALQADEPALLNLPPPSPADKAKLTKLEKRVESIVAMIQSGFKDGECVAATRVDPDRMKTVADQLKLIEKHVHDMERAIRLAIAERDGLKLVTAA